MGKVIKMGAYTQDGTMMSPTDALEGCLKDIASGDVDPTKLLIISLDDRDGSYQTSFWQAGMSCSQMVALLEVMKHVIITEQMGFQS